MQEVFAFPTEIQSRSSTEDLKIFQISWCWNPQTPWYKSIYCAVFFLLVVQMTSQISASSVFHCLSLENTLFKCRLYSNIQSVAIEPEYIKLIHSDLMYIFFKCRLYSHIHQVAIQPHLRTHSSNVGSIATWCIQAVLQLDVCCYRAEMCRMYSQMGLYSNLMYVAIGPTSAECITRWGSITTWYMVL